MTQAERNLTLLERVIPDNEKLYIWCYDRDGRLIATSCRDSAVLQDAFMYLGGAKKISALSPEETDRGPVLIGSSVGMQWAVTREHERSNELFFVIGPVFYQPPLAEEIRFGLTKVEHPSGFIAWSQDFLAALHEMPVLPYNVFIRYVLMIHNVLTGDHLGVEAVGKTETGMEHISASPAEQRDRSRVYAAEKAMLQVVREGDINYQDILQDSVLLSTGVPVRGKDPLRAAKTSIIVFTSLVCRAAIEGGLSPEVGYSLGDSYIQAVEDCNDSSEFSALAYTMYRDFIYRVHQIRLNPNYSHAVQKVCDFISLSLNRKIKTSELAELVGYSEYYLTEKFRKETGQSVSSYIRQVKIDRAKVLLESTDLSVRDIAERLAFNTPNYFIQTFREITGETPAQYRRKLSRE